MKTKFILHLNGSGQSFGGYSSKVDGKLKTLGLVADYLEVDALSSSALFHYAQEGLIRSSEAYLIIEELNFETVKEFYSVLSFILDEALDVCVVGIGLSEKTSSLLTPFMKKTLVNSIDELSLTSFERADV